MRPLALSLLLAALLAAGPAGSQPAAALPAEGMAMRLVSLLRGAPEVGQALADLGSREADRRAAESGRYPRLDLQGELGSLSTDLSRDPRAKVDSRVVAGTRYTLWDFGRNSARIAAAEHGVDAGRQKVRQALEGVALDALTTYLQVLRYALLREVGRDSERALATIEKLERRRVELGAAGITDARLAASRLALSANRLVQFEAALEEARSRFGMLFGFLPRPEELPPLRVPAAWLSDDTERLLVAVREESPELQAARAALQQARENLEAERAARWPAIDVTWSRRYEFPGGYADKPQVGLALSTSSLGVMEAQARVGRAAARVEQESEKVRQLERDLAQGVLAALQKYVLGRQREELLRTAATESSAVFQGRRRLNESGRETTLALLDAQVEANNVVIDWVNAVFDQRTAELELARQSGRLLPPDDDPLAWARALFAGEDFRAPVRQHLAVSAAPAAPAAPAALAAPAAPPPAPAAALPQPATQHSLGSLGADWSLRIGLVRVRR